MASGSVVFSKCAKVLSGTALLMAELVAPAERLLCWTSSGRLAKARIRGRRQGCSPTECRARSVVSALDPAEEDPEDAKEDEAPAPLALDEAFAWM